MPSDETFEEMIGKLLPEEIQDSTEKNLPSKVEDQPLLRGNAGYQPVLDEAQKVYLESYFKAQEGSPIMSMCLSCFWHDCHYKANCPLYNMSPPLPEEHRPKKGSPCHPPGTLVKTTTHGDIPIEDLDPENHRLFSWNKKHWRITGGTCGIKGYGFTVHPSIHIGELVRIFCPDGYEHKVTPAHLCFARFSEKAIDKFCVYLMRKGDFWRVGKTKLVKLYGESEYNHKSYMPFVNRAITEEADALWLLGVYDSNTEALLAEEFLAIKIGASRVSFEDCLHRKKSKWNGLYRWATKEQIRAHHQSLVKPLCHYQQVLEELGRSLEYPFWTKGGFPEDCPETNPRVRWPMTIRACNLLSEVMETPVIPKTDREDGREWKNEWSELWISREKYCGPVYSLDVEGYSTYFANEIATHNCPVEATLLHRDLDAYMRELDISEDNVVDVAILKEYLMWNLFAKRAREEMALDPQIVRRNFITLDKDGEPIFQEQLHPAFTMLEKQSRTKQKLLESLIATREAKAKDVNSKTKNFADLARVFRERVEEKLEEKRLKQVDNLKE